MIHKRAITHALCVVSKRIKLPNKKIKHVKRMFDEQQHQHQGHGSNVGRSPTNHEVTLKRSTHNCDEKNNILFQALCFFTRLLFSTCDVACAHIHDQITSIHELLLICTSMETRTSVQEKGFKIFVLVVKIAAVSTTYKKSEQFEPK